MPNASQIRSKLAEWIDGGISFREFEDWFVPETWNLENEVDPEAEALAADIDMAISEYGSGGSNKDELRAALAALAGKSRAPGSGIWIAVAHSRKESDNSNRVTHYPHVRDISSSGNSTQLVSEWRLRA
jgi:hypothetical protein